ncbi:KEOPS complex subunit Pcc1 [Halostella pelagica]|uniref:KEOPS complex subunit Pcc1 n=1 Tax=Halostella pelagica TaxID=2583824 RepID=UPI001081C492|nr:KEOPS complex subunit Pcc1 [Halostella pelagica]
MKRAEIRTELDQAALVAAAVAPDNTSEMTTTVERSSDSNQSETDDSGERETVVTRIERETTGGLQSTVDDYVVNVDVATKVVRHANDFTNTQS